MFLSLVNAMVSLLICIRVPLSVGRLRNPFSDCGVGCSHVDLYMFWMVFRVISFGWNLHLRYMLSVSVRVVFCIGSMLSIRFVSMC